MNLKYAIIGSGALGGFYGGNLAHAGHSVHFLFNSDYEHVREQGLKVDSVNGNIHIKPVNAYQHASDMPVCDVVLVCLKTINNYLLKKLLPPLLHNDTVIVLVQNGLGMEQKLAIDFPNHAIAGGLAFICSSKIGPGHIAHYDFGSIRFGYHTVTGKPEILEQICNDLTQAKIIAEITNNLNLARWQKLVWNIPYNGMTVVLNTTTENLMKQVASRQLIEDLMTEVVEAANSCGTPIKPDFVQKMMHITDKMKPYAPSMKLDFDSKRPMEIEAIYSYPIQTALNAGYKMTKTSMLEQELRFIQDSYIK